MSYVRGIEYATNDWLFGKGRNDYRSRTAAVAQNIKTRLQSFFQDCFFDANAGVDWFNLLGAKDKLALELAIASTILNTVDVTAIVKLFVDVDPITRRLTVSYSVATVYTNIPEAENLFDQSISLLLTESGDTIVTEDGDGLGTD